jgi:hypothetical protein
MKLDATVRPEAREVVQSLRKVGMVGVTACIMAKTLSGQNMSALRRTDRKHNGDREIKRRAPSCRPAGLKPPRVLITRVAPASGPLRPFVAVQRIDRYRSQSGHFTNMVDPTQMTKLEMSGMKVRS